MRAHLHKTLIATIALSISILGCEQDETPVMEPARITFKFDFKIGDQDLVFGQSYDVNGTAVSFDVVDYYVGGILLTQADGSTINLEDQYLLASNTSSALNGDLEVSDITSMKFFVGVDALTNSQSENDFTRRSANDPLGLQDPAMHWNWNTGYKFLRVDGDSDTDGDGVVDTGIAYHLGTDDLLQNFELDQRISIQSGENDIQFTFDLTRFFSGVDLSTEIDTHTGNNLPLAMRLAENLKTALTVQ